MPTMCLIRVVREAHTAATRENKEWQEKLPIVVLKAEEIMYSKANSEAEYTNLETLWDRVNDAINTIIRREETTETGDLLPPCVEAALNLGCIPVRASRSQRHSTPRTYLTPRTQEPSPAATRVADRTSDERCPQLLPFHSGSQLNFARTPVGNSPNFHSESNTYVNSRNSNLAAPRSQAFPPENILAGYNQVLAMDANTSMHIGSVYPLYYGTHYRTEEYQSRPQGPEITHSNMIYVGTPVITPSAIPEPTKQDYFVRPDTWGAQENPREAECDLSLRLGTFSHSFRRSEKSLACETDDVGSSTSSELCRLNEMRQSTNKEFCFFPGKPASDPFESSSRMWNPAGESQGMEAAARKGKEPYCSNEEDGHFCWQPGVPSNRFHS